MQHTSLLADTLNLTLFGMGFVFLFLVLLVFITQLMSVITQKINPKTEEDSPNKNTPIKQELDEETKFIIKQAIKMHRGA